MSATEDASTIRSAPHARRSILLALAAGVGLLAGGLLASVIPTRFLPPGFARFQSDVPWSGATPTAAEWPRPAAPGERVTRIGPAEGAHLRVEGTDPAAVALLAEQFERGRRSGFDLERAARARLRQAAAAERAGGPDVILSPAAECAGLLRARARVMRVLAPLETPPAADFEYSAPFLRAEVPVGDAALAHDPVALRAAIVDLGRLERAWLAGGARGASELLDAPLVRRWTFEQNAAADRLSETAMQIESTLTPADREAIDIATSGLVLELEPGVPGPTTALLAAVPPVLPEVTRAPGSRAALALAGGLLGAALITTLAALGMGVTRRRSVLARPRPARAFAAPAGVATDAPAWLQLVSGADRAAIGPAVMEIAARSAARHERVLVVDAGRRLQLHLAFDAKPHLGLTNCLSGEFPALGLVQPGGVAGVRFLAYGDPAVPTTWTALDRLLEEVRPHFDRVVLALPPDAPHEAGGILAGRLMDAWWAGRNGALPKAGLRLSDRMAIRFSSMHLRSTGEKPLEMLLRRVRELAAARAMEPSPEVLPQIPPVAAEPIAAPAEPTVLDSDLQVRERLRFLAWMRRVQAEGQRERREPTHSS